jgi:hypothetical protein
MLLMGRPQRFFVYRSRVVREPRAVLAEFGLEVPESVEIRVWDSNMDYILPIPRARRGRCWSLTTNHYTSASWRKMRRSSCLFTRSTPTPILR